MNQNLLKNWKNKNITRNKTIIWWRIIKWFYITLPDGSGIEKGDEPDYTLSEILKEDKVYIKSEQSSNKQTNVEKQIVKTKNEPISGSKLICKKGELDIFYIQIFN